MFNCLITGVGGQGTILASRLIGNAALGKGLEVRGSETIGMAQRGGSVASHLRMGHDIDSPLISPGEADAILAFEPCEAARSLPFLKPDGIMIAADKPIQPVGLPGGYDAASIIGQVKSAVRNLCVLDGRLIEEQCGAKCLNVAILGAALGCNALPFSLDYMADIIADIVAPKYVGMNKKALLFGAHMISSRDASQIF
jgi:indolepyruvate ferredoxin oxidoreductase beta subunit